MINTKIINHSFHAIESSFIPNQEGSNTDFVNCNTVILIQIYTVGDRKVLC